VTLPVYIAGGSSERLECDTAMRAVELAGGVITYAWTRAPEWEPGARLLTREEKRERAMRCLAAVADARLFWLRLPRMPSEGAGGELCTAITLRRWGRDLEVIVSGPMTPGRIFPELANRYFEHHDEALAYVVLRALAAKWEKQSVALLSAACAENDDARDLDADHLEARPDIYHNHAMAIRAIVDKGEG
jgi:hypothetical protein